MAASCLQEARQVGDGKILKAVTMGTQQGIRRCGFPEAVPRRPIASILLLPV